MVPVAKRNHKLTPVKNQRGQISIFFSASLVVLISIIAFVINIGLFVKAKINLQNATDAAAFAGAAVQARQLTKIAYLNWEMRNVYKEWMYKYYVVGNLNINDVEDPTPNGKAMSFRLQNDYEVLRDRTTRDQYNIPAICIHITGSQTNICKRYSVPGLPEFGSSSLVGAEEASRAFMNTLIATKVNDCVDRTRFNMLVANTWTYNVLDKTGFDNSLAGQGPAILSDRQGAWPKAVELAIRIRNLEHVMNRPAEIKGICSQGTTNAGLTSCKTSIASIQQERKLGNERITKAFFSGYRNLGNATENEMKESFTLTELPPTAVPMNRPTDASMLLVPQGKITEKQWVDLKLQLVNYAIFYAALIPRADSASSGACDISKVAIPVPGYPLGFYKNPDLVTYYAVRGEAEFTGMFNPFRTNDGVVKLTTYSAAKPFGGRIGPMLFFQGENSDAFTGRKDAKHRSQPYITSYDFVGTPKRNGQPLTLGEFEPGIPLPINSAGPPGNFWLETDSSPVGGLLADPAGIRFGLPNLVYDYQSPVSSSGYLSGADKIHRIFSQNDPDGGDDLAVGLFSKEQFQKFKGSALTNDVSPETLNNEIARVKAPTLYEAANYLIPTPHTFNKEKKLDSFGFFEGPPVRNLPNGVSIYSSKIYAPLFGNGTNQADLLYDNVETVISSIENFMRNQETALDKYKQSLNKAAQTIYLQKNELAPEAMGAAPGFETAAKGVSDINFQSFNLNANPGSCQSIAGQFLYFYKADVFTGQIVGDETGCPEPLGRMLRRYFTATSEDGTYDPQYYNFELSWPYGNSDQGLKMLSAYMPGPFTGVGNDGMYSTPIPGSNLPDELMRRNFYSTKFVTLDSLRGGKGYQENSSNFLIYSEGSVQDADQDQRQKTFKNLLDTAIIGSDIDSIKY